MYKVLDKDIIKKEIVVHLPLPKRGFPPTVALEEIVNAILYKLKTGVHWELLPVSSLFTEKKLSWQSVYYHYRKWSVNEDLKNCWIQILKNHKSALDLSSVDFDGSLPLPHESFRVVKGNNKKNKFVDLLL